MYNFAGRSGGTRRAPGCAGCLVPLAGLFFLAAGIFFGRDTLLFLPGTVTAQGTIIACSYDETDPQSSACSPTVRFLTQSGQTLTIHSPFGSSSFSSGQSVQIRYHPNTPQDGRIDSFESMWAISLSCIGSGLLVLILGSFAILRGTQRGKFGE